MQQRIETIADDIQNCHSFRASVVRQTDAPERSLYCCATVSERN
jgi:hypothetical protein